VKEQPGHIDQRELARILRERWALAPGRLRHLPVGFGDHQWELTGAAGGRWFITVAELAGGWRGTSPGSAPPPSPRRSGRSDDRHRAG